MILWWNSLGLASQIFYCIAIPTTLLLLIQTVLLFVGVGDELEVSADAAPDVDFDGDGVFGDGDLSEVADVAGLEGLRIFTARGLVAFFVVFGWVGVVMTGAGAKLWLTLPVATVSGFAMMLLLAVLLRLVLKLKSDGNTDNRNAIGTAGKVYLTIPPARSGEGKVQLMLQGSLVERGAVTDETDAIPTGSEVVVLGVSGQTDLVVRRK